MNWEQHKKDNSMQHAEEDEPPKKKLKSSSSHLNGDAKQNGHISPNERVLSEKSKGEFSRNYPKLHLTDIGERSCLQPNMGVGTSPLFLMDFQNLFVYALAGPRAPYKPRWCNLLRRGKVAHVVLVIVEGVGLSDLESHFKSDESEPPNALSEGEEAPGFSPPPPRWLQRCLPQSAQLFNLQVELFSPFQYSTEIVPEVFIMPVSKRMGVKLVKSHGTLEKAAKVGVILKKKEKDKDDTPPPSPLPATAPPTKPAPDAHMDAFNRCELLLSLQQMYELGYPLHLEGAAGSSDKAFRETLPAYMPVTDSSPMFGIDCEMCGTTVNQSELTSVSVVNEKLEVVYSTLVKPDNPIVDYRTRFSGITPAMLKNVTKRVADVQKDLGEILPPDAILVGHNVNFDLLALKVSHPYVIDTSLIFNLSGIRTMRPGLKLLMKVLLKKDIQTRGHLGHDPSEDASAALQLVQLKLKHNLSFGDMVLNPMGDFDSEEIWQLQRQIRMAKMKGHEAVTKRPVNKERPKSDVGDYDSFMKNSLLFISEMCSIGLHTTPTLLENNDIYNIPTISVTTSKKSSKIFKSVAQHFSKKELTIAHIKVEDLENDQKELDSLDKGLKRIHESLPEKSLFLTLFTGCSQNALLKESSGGCVLLTLKGQDKHYRLKR